MGDDRALVRAFSLLAFVHWTGAPYGDAAAAAERTIRHATAAGDQATARRFLGSLAISALYGPMPVPEAIATCEEVLARAQDDRKVRARAELAMGELEAMRGTSIAPACSIAGAGPHSRNSAASSLRHSRPSPPPSSSS